ncbi:solute carrier family 25 member 48 isoform X3 [Sciurus carolinensis]|uniref:solute carrier family 25 member 48 isoform X3 n=1 Tax=Sciurus carolinensis TaxID=30640 RepID=UPI001FB51FF7|nr:solute carrier family 25 member 48 isoform X3 [Sciurus carolinensis]
MIKQSVRAHSQWSLSGVHTPFGDGCAPESGDVASGNLGVDWRLAAESWPRGGEELQGRTGRSLTRRAGERSSKVAGAASVIVGHPLDTVKTRLQAGVGYRNTLSCIRMVYKRESVFGFFKGMSFPLASIAVYNSVVFGVFSNTQRFLSQHRCGELESSPRHSLSDLLLASMVAGMVSVGLGGPVDLIKIRLQMQTQPFQEGAISWGTATPMDVVKSRLQADGVYLNKYKGVLDCISQSYQQEGLKVFFRGITVNAVRGFPMSAAMFLGYELSLQALRGDQAVTSP